MTRAFEFIRRGVKKPPHVIARWAMRQVRAEWDLLSAPRLAATLTAKTLPHRIGFRDVETAWKKLSAGPPLAFAHALSAGELDQHCPGAAQQILVDAEAILSRNVAFLGSPSKTLGTPIDWSSDFKSGFTWPQKPFRRLQLVDLTNDADVKVPWELARLQWLIPCAQAYQLTDDDKYAAFVRQIIEEFDNANPVTIGVTWACCMDVALRTISLVHLFQVFNAVASWDDEAFRLRLLKMFYLHGRFIARHLEWSDINGNHLTTDLAGLLIVGLFLGDAPEPKSWADLAWHHLQDQLPKQVTPDGVNFEASTGYHRLVLELFLWPAIYLKAHGKPVDGEYQHKLVEMAEFIATYSRDDGSTPLWGDADDGRVLPFGPQPMWDHRYMIGLTGLALDHERLKQAAFGPKDEILWALGPKATATLDDEPAPWSSQAFPDGGVFVMRSPANDHVFIDCGPVGMGGRGGHGHNDCLSLEVALLGQTLLVDSGTYVYSADPDARNRFRRTAAHNTPQIDGEEINRFVSPDFLWTLHDDAKPDVRKWAPGQSVDLFIGSHSGYHRLPSPVTPTRTIVLDKMDHWVAIADRFDGSGDHQVRVPYHFAPEVEIEPVSGAVWRLKANGQQFLFVASASEQWQMQIEDVEVSRSYGVKQASKAIVFSHLGSLAPLTVALRPEAHSPADVGRWLTSTIDRVF